MATFLASVPRIVEQSTQPYVAVRGLVTMQTFAAIADRIPDVLAWLAARGIPPAGAPFFRFHAIEGRWTDVEAGVPVAAAVTGDSDVRAGVLPAGRYATVCHFGHPDGLFDVAAELLAWAAEQGLAWDMTTGEAGERWGCRLERYKTDPGEEPDLHKWETELAFRLADESY